MAQLDVRELAVELLNAHATAQTVEKPSDRFPEFDLTLAYAVLKGETALRTEAGKPATGRKIGFSNKAVWPKLNLDTIVWGYVFEDTVKYVEGADFTFSLEGMIAPKIEPEIVFKLKHLLPEDGNLEQTLEAIEWVAFGFEIVDCLYPGWSFKPADMVAALAFHRALIIGQPRPASDFENLGELLANFKAKLYKNETVAIEGAATNVYGSPALSLAELGRLLYEHQAPLQPGEIITSGTITDAPLISAGEEWSLEIDGFDIPTFKLRTV